jgi:serine protease
MVPATIRKEEVGGMKKLIIVVVLALFLVPAFAGHGRIERAEKPIPGQYIVVLADGVTRGDFGTDALLPSVGDVAGHMGRAYGGNVHQVYDKAIKGFAVAMTEEQAQALARDPRVAYVEEDAVITLDTTQTGATWGIDRIDQASLPLSTTYTYNYTGAGVHAYMIDTGILGTHVDFTGRMGAGYTAFNDGRGTTDCYGHGTHTAGTAGGTTYGVAKGVTLHPVKVFNCQASGTTSGIIGGINWVTSNRILPAVANMSFGGSTSTSLDTAVTNLIAAGVTASISAGNSNRNACSYSPARVPAAITVGATTSSDARASWSNYGSCLDLFAPGNSIKSDYYTSTTATATMSGTSMSAPHVRRTRATPRRRSETRSSTPRPAER